MAIDISELGKIESSAEVETTIGKLSLFFLSLKHSYILSTALSHADNEKKPLQCIKILITLVYYPKDNLKNGKYKPEERVLNLEDVNKLSEEEIENLAEIYIENNSSLYKRKNSWVELNDEGKEIHRFKYEGIKFPRKECEPSIVYLYRLICLENERKQKQMKDMMSSIPNLGSFSPELQEAVAGNLISGNAITEAMKTNTLFRSNLKEAANSHHKLNNNIMQVQDKIARARKEPLDKLGEKLDTLIEFTSRSTENLIQGNAQQTQMHSENKSVVDETNRIQKEIIKEIKRSGIESNRYAVANLIVAIVVVILTVYGLFFR